MKSQICANCGRHIERDQRARLIAGGKLVHLNCQSVAPKPKRGQKQ